MFVADVSILTVSSGDIIVVSYSITSFTTSRLLFNAQHVIWPVEYIATITGVKCSRVTLNTEYVQQDISY